MESVYRIVSKPGMNINVGMIHIALIAKKRKTVYDRNEKDPRKVIARRHALNEQQLSCENG